MISRQSSPFHVRFIEQTTSTNDVIKQALNAGEAEGLVVRARRQVAGYGRQGRAWTSPEGGLYCSLLLRPDVEAATLPTLSLVVGMAVRRALMTFADPAIADAIQIKWPNDVVLARFENTSHEEVAGDVFCDSAADASINARAFAPAKLCGISLEAHGGGVCVGVGVNVLPPPQRLDVGGKNQPAYLADFAAADVTVERMLDALLVAFAPLYEAWKRDGFASFVDEFNTHASLTRCSVSMVDRAGATLATGTVRRVDEQGRLVLVDEAGIETPVSSGEAHIV